MRRLVSMVCVAFAACAGVWFAAPAAGTSAGLCSGDIVVSIGVKLRAHPSLSSVVVDLAAPIGPGEYLVTSFSSDTRSGTDKVQEHEQWTVTLVTAGGPTATLGPTSDLEDHIEYTSVADTLGQVVVTDPVVSLTIRHVSNSGGGDSVTAECVGFTRVSEPPPGPEEPPPVPGPGGEEPPPVVGPGGEEPPPVVGPGGEEPPPVPGPAEGEPPPTLPAAPARISSEAVVDCGEGTVTVRLLNDGGTDALVDVAVPRSAVARGLGVRSGQTTTTTVPLSPDTEDHRLAIRVIDPETGGDLTSTIVGVDCFAEPDVVAAIVLDCPSQRVLVDLANRGGEPTRLTVLDERTSFEQVELAAGSTDRVELSTEGRAEVTVLVLDEDGRRVLDRRIEVDCPRAELSASAELDCATGEVVVEARNHGDLTGSATLWFADRVLEVRVEAGAVVSVGSPLSAMGSDRVVSVESGGETIYTTTIDDDCVEPSAELDIDCSSLVLQLANAGDGTADFGVEMLVGGVPTLSQQIAVPPGRAEFSLPPINDYGWVIRVTEASQAGVVAEFSGELDCRRPWADVEIDCAAGTAEVRLGVDGRSGARFVVLVDDVVVDRWVAIAGGSSSESTLLLQRGAETVSVLADASSGPVASSPVVCDGDGAGASRTVSALVAIMVAISLVTAVAWKGI